jgi:hypothetical protein
MKIRKDILNVLLMVMDGPERQPKIEEKDNYPKTTLHHP